MADPLATYLRDHLAGSNFAVELLASLCDQYENQPLGRLAESVLAEVHQDREVLKQIVELTGEGGTDLKETAAWLAQKVSKLKLHRDSNVGLPTFEALETPSLGMMGKVALWQALGAIADADARLSGFDFAELLRRAREQHQRIDRMRLDLARRVFVRGA